MLPENYRLVYRRNHYKDAGLKRGMTVLVGTTSGQYRGIVRGAAMAMLWGDFKKYRNSSLRGGFEDGGYLGLPSDSIICIHVIEKEKK